MKKFTGVGVGLALGVGALIGKASDLNSLPSLYERCVDGATWVDGHLPPLLAALAGGVVVLVAGFFLGRELTRSLPIRKLVAGGALLCGVAGIVVVALSPDPVEDGKIVEGKQGISPNRPLPSGSNKGKGGKAGSGDSDQQPAGGSQESGDTEATAAVSAEPDPEIVISPDSAKGPGSKGEFCSCPSTKPDPSPPPAGGNSAGPEVEEPEEDKFFAEVEREIAEEEQQELQEELEEEAAGEFRIRQGSSGFLRSAGSA